MDPTQTPAKAEKQRRFFTNPWNWTLAILFLWTFLLGLRLLTDFDLGYHLKSGQWIVENHAFPEKDTFTYTANQNDYVDTYWLYQVGLFLLQRLGGYPLLSLANALVLLAAFVLLYLRLRDDRTPQWMAFFLLVPAVSGSETRFLTRPEALTYVFLPATLWVLERRFQGKATPLFLLPLIQLVWVNSHGLYILGWAVMVFYLASGRWHQGNWDRPLLYYGLAAAGCSFLNPYGLKGVLFPFHLFLRLQGTILKNNIAEFKSPWTPVDALFYSWFSVDTYKALSILILLLVLSTWSKRKLHELLLAGTFLYLSATAVKNLPLLPLACLPVAASSWKNLEWGWVRKSGGWLSKPWVAGTAALLLLLFCARVATNAYYLSDRRTDRFGWGLDTEVQPVKAAGFLARNQLHGRIINQINCGGWLDWQGPQKTYIDGRTEVMGDALFAEHGTTFSKGGLAALADKYGADIIFFNPFAASYWIFALKQMPDWRLVYLDEYFAIYLRKGYAPSVPALDPPSVLAQRGIDPRLPDQASQILQAPHPTHLESWLEGFYRPQIYPNGLYTMAMFCFYDDLRDLAEGLFLESIRRSGGRYYEFYLNAGSYYAYVAKRPDYARFCGERVLEDSADNETALRLSEKTP